MPPSNKCRISARLKLINAAAFISGNTVVNEVMLSKREPDSYIPAPASWTIVNFLLQQFLAVNEITFSCYTVFLFLHIRSYINFYSH